MRISTKGRYALRLLADLAEHDNEGYVALKDVAERQEISKKYLELIVPVFVKKGILQTNRGYMGGYKLTVPPEEITVGAVLRLTETTLAPVTCLEEGAHCPRGELCPTMPVWKGLYKVINDYLDGVTLRDILNQSPNAGDDYCI